MKLINTAISLSRVGLAAIILCLSYSAWFVLNHFPNTWGTLLPRGVYYTTLLNISHAAFFFSIYGVIASIITVITRKICGRYQEHPVWVYLLSLMRALKVGALLITLNLAGLSLGIPEELRPTVYQINHVTLFSILGWCAFQLIQVGESLILQHLSMSAQGNRDLRRRYTHIVIIKRILILLLAVMTSASALMTFEKIRAAGTAILASAGVFVTITSLSARGLLESIFKGMQLAISQPIRLEDTVTIGGETGVVTAITLHHVVVTLGDRSQLIVPTGEFLDKTFRNWTHSSDDLVGTLYFSINYNVPVEAVRAQFKEIVKASEYWDQGIAEVHVNDFKKNWVELKLMMSAKSGRQLTKLRNDVLERLLEYMQKNHSDGLIN